jgi:hypothetical protein
MNEQMSFSKHAFMKDKISQDLRFSGSSMYSSKPSQFLIDLVKTLELTVTVFQSAVLKLDDHNYHL